MKVIAESGRSPIKAWIDGVELEDAARAQLLNVASLPFIHKHVAVMPDVHWGMGATVGSVIPTTGAIVPAAVGVDIGCGMMAVRTSLRADQLPDNLSGVRSAIEAAVPHGRSANGQAGDDVGAWSFWTAPDPVVEAWRLMAPALDDIVAKHPKIAQANTVAHLGTLGTGNHFIEVCLDESDRVWLMLHSGSRGIGNRIGSYFIERARRQMERWFVSLPDKDLAYLPDDTEDFRDYVEAVGWAQRFAMTNRELMMGAVRRAVSTALGLDVGADEVAVRANPPRTDPRRPTAGTSARAASAPSPSSPGPSLPARPPPSRPVPSPALAPRHPHSPSRHPPGWPRGAVAASESAATATSPRPSPACPRSGPPPESAPSPAHRSWIPPLHRNRRSDLMLATGALLHPPQPVHDLAPPAA